ncbi:MAG: hypothetical protein GYA23_00495 [Methanomicrobiales archaeon]|nr:hypothetical protein [Methanomicrobiales archaeon]
MGKTKRTTEGHMDKLNLAGDETVLKRIPRVIMSGGRYEAVLTSQRLILAERDTGEVKEAFPYSAISLAVSGYNSIREPTLRILVTPASGEQRTLELVFVHQPGGLNVQGLEFCSDILREHGVAVQKTGTGQAAGIVPRSMAISPSMQGGDSSRPGAPTPRLPIRGSGAIIDQLPPESSPGGSWLYAIGALIVIVLIIAAGTSLAGQGSGHSPAGDTPQPTAPVVVLTAVQTFPVAVTPYIPVTTQEAVTPATLPTEISIPPNGFFLRITYVGKYQGSLKARGWTTVVNNTGPSLIQIPTEETLLEGAIEKGDGSGDRMDVEMFNGGVLVWKESTAKPRGTIDLHIDIGKAIISQPQPTLTPAPPTPVPTPDAALILHPVPASGVWVRIAYAGNFTGTLSSNGMAREVSGSAVQLYQLPIASGQVDGYITKGDGSARILVTEVYKDGTRLSVASTTRPDGVAEFHTMV